MIHNAVSRLTIAAALAMVICTLPVRAQSSKSTYPPISKREFTGGSVTLKVTGAFSIDGEVDLNTKASISGGDMTWLQFGASGADEPNVLITFTDIGETGINVARGKLTSTVGIMPGEKSECSGKVDVTAKEISGHYTCKGATSYDPRTFKMGKIDIEVRFTAKS